MKSTGKKFVSGILLLSSLAQAPLAHADVIYDLPNLEEGEAPPVPMQPQAPTAPVAPTSPTAPVAPTAPSTSTRQSQQTGWTMLEKISRRTGGDLFTIELQKAMPLLRLELRIDGNRAKVLETILITTQGRRISVRELTRTGVLESGSNNLSENLNLADDIKKIEVRIESYGPEATVLFSAVSDAGYPRLKATRARVVTPETPETNQPTVPATPPVTPKPARPQTPPAPPKIPTDRRDLTLRPGDRVLSNNKYSGVVTRHPVNGKVWVRDNDDGKAYERSAGEVVKEVATDSSGRHYRGVKVISNNKYPGVVTRVYANDLIMVRDNDDGKEYARQRSALAIVSNCLPDGTYCVGTRVLSNKKYQGKIVSVAGTSIMVRDDDDGKEYARTRSSLLLEANCSKPFCKGDRVISNNQYPGTIVAIYQGGIFMIRDHDDGKLYARNRTSLRPR